jgi:AcrR family transcriptional regulator
MSTSERRGYHHGDLRRALLDAALEILERQGADSVGLREVARAAGVSPAAPYRHFPSREALLAAAAAHGFNLLEQALRAAGDRRAMGQAYVDFALAHRGLFRLMFSIRKADHPELMEAAGRAMEPLAQSTAGRGGRDARHAAIGLWALVHGLAALMSEDQLSADLVAEHERAGLVGAVTDALARGLS